MTRDELIQEYLDAVNIEGKEIEDLDALETAGYWLRHADHNPRGEFEAMLKLNGITIGFSEDCDGDPFYETVDSYLRGAGV